MRLMEALKPDKKKLISSFIGAFPLYLFLKSLAKSIACSGIGCLAEYVPCGEGKSRSLMACCTTGGCIETWMFILEVLAFFVASFVLIYLIYSLIRLGKK